MDGDESGGNLTSILAGLNATPAAEDATDYFYQVEQLTFLWVLFTLIVLGNSTVLVALTVSKGRKSRMNFFIKNLAAADLCVGLINVLTDIIWKITISFEAGPIACKLIRFLQASVTYASTYVLVALSIDRYDAITHPMNFSGSWRRAKGLIIVAWLLSFLFSAPILHFYETAETEDYGTQCWIEFDEAWKWKLYMTLISVTLFFIPALLIGGCYIIIVITIWSKGREMVPAGATSGAHNQGSSSVRSACEVLLKKKRAEPQNNADDLESRRASSRGLIPKAKVKTVKMTFVIIFVFILCWSPYIIFDLLQVFDCIPKTHTFNAVATFIQSLAPLNSAANPLIYCLFSTNAGKNFCNLFACRSRARRRAKGLSSSGGPHGLGGHVGTSGRTVSRGHLSAQNTKSTSLNFDSTSSALSSSRASRATTSSSSGSNGILKKPGNGSSGGGGGSHHVVVRGRSGGGVRDSLVINNF